MASITTRAAKGTPLTHAEVDANFTNLNTDKLDVAGIALGTAASPTVKFTGDINTGLYSPGADQLSISTGGTERFRIDNNGQLEAVSLGSAASPTYTFTTDPDTGLYSPGANQVALATGGIERARIDSNGCVGFGMTPDNQAYRLQIYNPSQDVAAISLGNTTSGSGALNGLVILQNQNDTQINNRENGFLSVATNNTERARIDSSGRLLVGLTSANASGGILQLSSGITFPAAQVASADPNTLDDYEEGTWTPSVGGNATHGLQVGTYTKIGRQVTISFDISIITIGTGDTTRISGLPFGVSSTGEGRGATGYFASLATNVIALQCYAANSGSFIYFNSMSASGATVTQNTAIFGNSARVQGTVTYFTA